LHARKSKFIGQIFYVTRHEFIFYAVVGAATAQVLGKQHQQKREMQLIFKMKL